MQAQGRSIRPQSEADIGQRMCSIYYCRAKWTMRGISGTMFENRFDNFHGNSIRKITFNTEKGSIENNCTLSINSKKSYESCFSIFFFYIRTWIFFPFSGDASLSMSFEKKSYFFKMIDFLEQPFRGSQTNSFSFVLLWTNVSRKRNLPFEQ